LGKWGLFWVIWINFLIFFWGLFGDLGEGGIFVREIYGLKGI
jgi:hypothetical protein